MGFLDNTSITVDAILTKTGRERLSQGTFQITKFSLSDEEIDLSNRSADVALRVKKPTQLNLIYKKFVNFHNHIYASSDYLQKKGIPRNNH